MSPTVDRRQGFVFYFHSFDVSEGRPARYGMSTKDVVLEITRPSTDESEFVYTVGHGADEYRWPMEALIHQVRIDAIYLHVELVDGRNLSVSLLDSDAA